MYITICPQKWPGTLLIGAILCSRARKQVDYSVSGENDFEGDNDDGIYPYWLFVLGLSFQNIIMIVVK